MDQPILGPLELATKFRDHLRAILHCRLGYYLMRIPSEKDIATLHSHFSEDGNTASYFHGNECLMRVDMSDPHRARISGWDIITKAEVDGSAPGPPSFGNEDTAILQKIGMPSEFTVQHAPLTPRGR